MKRILGFCDGFFHRTHSDLRGITQTTTLTPNLVLPNGAKFAEEKPPEVEVKINLSQVVDEEE